MEQQQLQQPTLADLERATIELRQSIQAEATRHSETMQRLNAELASLSVRAKMMIANIDPDKIEQAKCIVDVRGIYAKAGEDREIQRCAAIAAILAGGERLRHEYFGTKDYAHWHGQAANHAYGMSPRHGSIIFSIGLTAEVRKRPAPMLTEQEIEATVHYLRNLEAVQNAASIALAA